MIGSMKKASLLPILACLIVPATLTSLHAQTLHWKGHEWRVTAGGMAGVAPGDPTNVNIDKNGYIHLQIANREGKWTASELFTTDKLGFGAYQWVIEGGIYDMDKATVLGLFPYGPVAHLGVDAENEIDIEFSKWNNTCHGCNADFTVYPSTGNRKPKGVSSWEDNFHVSGGSLTTARMEWAANRIIFTIMKGAQPIGRTASVIKTETYSSSATDIPQVALPVGINLWAFKEIPAKNQSVVIRDFQFVPQ